MIQKRMRVSMAVTLAMLFVMLAFGRGRLAWFYDDVGTAAAEFAAAFRLDHLGVGVGESAAEITPSVTAPSGAAASPANPPQESSAGPAGETPAGSEQQSEPEVPDEEPSTLPDPQALRDSAAAEVDALDPLHDELIEVLEAIQEAQTDYWEKRWAGNRVTMARFTKRHDRGRLGDAAAEEEWRVRSARRRAAIIRTGLERKIEEARATLARVRQSP